MSTPVVYKAFKKLPDGRLQSLGDGTNAIVASLPKREDTPPDMPPEPVKASLEDAKYVVRSECIGEVMVPQYFSWTIGPHFSEDPIICLNQVREVDRPNCVIARIKLWPGFKAKDGTVCDRDGEVAVTTVRVKYLMYAMVTRYFSVGSILDGVTGVIHREDGPAYRELFGSGGVEKWFTNGLVDRPFLDGPAETTHNADGELVEERYVQGGIEHRPPELGPSHCKWDTLIRSRKRVCTHYAFKTRVELHRIDGPAFFHRQMERWGNFKKLWFNKGKQVKSVVTPNKDLDLIVDGDWTVV